MSEDKKKKILDDIKRTGFVAELNVASVFLKNSWLVNHNSSYLDKDQEKSREIDLVAQKFDFEPRYGFRQDFYTAIEVKSSKKPWIIFTGTRSEKLTSEWASLFSIKNLLLIKHLGSHEIQTNFMRAGQERIGTAFHEAFKSPNQPSQIFDAVISVCKAVTFMKDNFEQIKGVVENTPYNPKEYHFLGVFVPLIIVDGELYEAFLDNAGEVVLEERKYIPLRFSYSSPKYNLQSSLFDSSSNLTYFPDIVTYNGLNEYLQMLDAWRDAIFSEVQLQLDSEIGE